MIEKVKEQQQAIALRKKGLSYSEIRKLVPSAKSSLSAWLRHIPLTQEQKDRLKDISQGAGARARRNQRLVKQNILEQEAKEEFKKFNQDAFFLFGLALYWAEGTKVKPWRVGTKTHFCNSDEKTILIMRKWFRAYCGATKDSFIYRLYIHKTADIMQARSKWAHILETHPEEISISIKKNNTKARHPNYNYKGLIGMTVRRGTWTNRRIELWTTHAAKFFMESVQSPV